MAEHVLVKHEKVTGEALVPTAALDHYKQRGWSKVEGKEAEAVSAAASTDEVGQAVVNATDTADLSDLSSLTREALLDEARSRGLDVDSKTTKAELLRRLDAA